MMTSGSNYCRFLHDIGKALTHEVEGSHALIGADLASRLGESEEFAGTQAGVERVLAMQAGREIRVTVRPGDVDDVGAAVLAPDGAKQIEDELTYPGQIRVTVVRESRVSEIAR